MTTKNPLDEKNKILEASLELKTKLSECLIRLSQSQNNLEYLVLEQFQLWLFVSHLPNSESNLLKLVKLFLSAGKDGLNDIDGTSMIDINALLSDFFIRNQIFNASKKVDPSKIEETWEPLTKRPQMAMDYLLPFLMIPFEEKFYFNSSHPNDLIVDKPYLFVAPLDKEKPVMLDVNIKKEYLPKKQVGISSHYRKN